MVDCSQKCVQFWEMFTILCQNYSHYFQLEMLLYYSLACVAWRFWLGALSNKGGRGQRNREEIGAEATWKTRRSFSHASRANFAATPLLRPAQQNPHATQANYSLIHSHVDELSVVVINHQVHQFFALLKLKEALQWQLQKGMVNCKILLNHGN